jgi:hypothetical protein
MEEFLKNFTSHAIKTTGVIGVFGRNENQRNKLAFIDKLFLNHVVPDGSKYIVYGIAVK